MQWRVLPLETHISRKFKSSSENLSCLNGSPEVLVNFEYLLLGTQVFCDFKMCQIGPLAWLSSRLREWNQQLWMRKPIMKQPSQHKGKDSVTCLEENKELQLRVEVKLSLLSEIGQWWKREKQVWAQGRGTVTQWHPEGGWHVLVRVFGTRIKLGKKLGRAGRSRAQDWVGARMF